MIPTICVTQAPEWQELLHGEDHWTSSSWPFLMMTTQTEAAVVPFETIEDGTIEPMVAIIPRGYDSQAYLSNMNNLVNEMRLSGAEVIFRHYVDCTHLSLKKASPGMLKDFVSYLLSRKCPVLITTLK